MRKVGLLATCAPLILHLAFSLRQRTSLSHFTLEMSADDAMTSTYSHLADRCLNRYRVNPEKQYWIGIAGGPGSGKSTLASAVCKLVNAGLSSDLAVVIPMDGYHYSRSQLREMSVTEERSFEDLLARRGSPWTFDAEKLVKDLLKAKSLRSMSFPTYSRQLSDPVQGKLAHLNHIPSSSMRCRWSKALRLTSYRAG